MASATATFSDAQFLPIPTLPSGVTASFDDANRFLIRGIASGPGWSWWALDETSTRIGVLANFYLTPDQMPADGTVFVSTPAIRFAGEGGDMFAHTSAAAISPVPWIPSDDPSAVCTLRLAPLTVVGGEFALYSTKRVPLASVSNADWSHDGPKRIPNHIVFEPLTFELDRNQTLGCELLASFEMYLEGGSYIWFGASGFPFIPPIIGWLPEWTINSID